jgi:hypothetical protein
MTDDNGTAKTFVAGFITTEMVAKATKSLHNLRNHSFWKSGFFVLEKCSHVSAVYFGVALFFSF